jgi:hypothetical protein
VQGLEVAGRGTVHRRQDELADARKPAEPVLGAVCLEHGPRGLESVVCRAKATIDSHEPVEAELGASVHTGIVNDLCGTQNRAEAANPPRASATLLRVIYMP